MKSKSGARARLCVEGKEEYGEEEKNTATDERY